MPEPWEQQQDETPLMFERFIFYRSLEPSERTYNKVALEFNRTQQAISLNGAKHDWVARAKAWDVHLKAQNGEATQAELDEIDKWLNRREVLREFEWEQSDALMEKVAQMLRVPILMQRRESREVRAFDENGEPITVPQQVTIFEPAKWSFRDAAAMIEVADKLRRLALNMPTATAKVELEAFLRNTAAEMGLDPDDVVIEAEAHLLTASASAS